MSGVINDARQVTKKTNRFVNDSRKNDGHKGNNETNNQDVGESNGKITTLARENAGEFFNEWGNGERKENGGADNHEAKASLE